MCLTLARRSSGSVPPIAATTPHGRRPSSWALRACLSAAPAAMSFWPLCGVARPAGTVVVWNVWMRARLLTGRRSARGVPALTMPAPAWSAMRRFWRGTRAQKHAALSVAKKTGGALLRNASGCMASLCSAELEATIAAVPGTLASSMRRSTLTLCSAGMGGAVRFAGLQPLQSCVASTSQTRRS